jgi:hypothetical protein
MFGISCGGAGKDKRKGENVVVLAQEKMVSSQVALF